MAEGRTSREGDHLVPLCSQIGVGLWLEDIIVKDVPLCFPSFSLIGIRLDQAIDLICPLALGFSADVAH